MKFYTRELLERAASADPAIAAAAEKEWEQVNDRYEEHLKCIKSDLPPHIRELNDLLLHDALVSSIASEGSRLVMVLRKEIPPRTLVHIHYDLVEPPRIEPQFLPPAQRLAVMDFQYDELDVERHDGRTTFRQSILFGNGWEMTLHFSDARATQAEPIYPAPEVTLMPMARAPMPQPA